MDRTIHIIGPYQVKGTWITGWNYVQKQQLIIVALFKIQNYAPSMTECVPLLSHVERFWSPQLRKPVVITTWGGVHVQLPSRQLAFTITAIYRMKAAFVMSHHSRCPILITATRYSSSSARRRTVLDLNDGFDQSLISQTSNPNNRKTMFVNRTKWNTSGSYSRRIQLTHISKGKIIIWERFRLN